MLSRMSSRVGPSDGQAKTRHERLTRFVVVEDPGRQADRRICKPVKRLRAVRHLDGVAQAMLVEKGEPIESVLLVGCETGWRRRTGKARPLPIVWHRPRHLRLTRAQFL